MKCGCMHKQVRMKESKMNNSWLGLEGKSVVITGGASGIAYAIAKEFLADGANVTVCDINPNPQFDAKEGQ